VITESIYLGTGHRIHVRLDDGTPLVVLEQSTGSLTEPEQRGDRVVASWARGDAVRLGPNPSKPEETE
jgi:putative spermidine/putrescine transport system ATP-binding protein